MSDQNDKMLQMQTILKKSLVTIKKLEAEVQDLKHSSGAPIAIIGMGTRMPGNVNSPEDLWQLLVKKEDTITEIPKDRWDGDAIFNEDPLVPGKSTSKHGAFLSNNVKTFDAGFFGITPREAKSIDPMQRMLLEVTQETLEKSGISPSTIRGSKTGVFLGLGNSDYMQARLRSGNLEDVDVYDATGIPFATAAGRLSYLFDLQGPSIAIDTACSSALVSLHMAADSLRKKESNIAIAGAASLMLTPELYIALTKLGSLANDGKCRAFDDDASGYIRGEGCGIVLLKRLSDAEADGDNILAVIKGSAVQHDGLSNGFTAPNPEVQIRVIGEALKNAGVDPKTIGFVEAHGLGNKFTDALEIQAIQEAYGNRENPIYMGSVKPNIGHMEAAIGMAMLAKVIASLQHQQIAPNINFETPNKDVDWNAIKVQIPTDVIDWKPENEDKPLRAAINLSGYSGTNVHMIFEAYTAKKEVKPAGLQPASNFNISAKSKEALDLQIENYISWLTKNPSVDYKDLLYTLSTGRSNYDYKLSAQFENTQALLEGLTTYKTDGKHKAIAVNDVELARNKDVAFLFTGQGAQYHGMCQDLYKSNSVFKNALDKCNELLNRHLDQPILDVLYGDDEDIIHQTIYAQPALFAVEYALSELWKSWGIQPAAVVGHSVGEFVALTVAGVLSLEDALMMISKRGQLMQSLPLNEGGMVAVLAEQSIVEPYLEDFKNVNIAAINSPKALTISGHKDEVGQVLTNLKADKVKAVGLTVSHAFHSYLMEPILGEFEKVAQSIKLNAPQIPLISNVTGKELLLSDLGPKYFSDHIRGTVQYWNNVTFLDETLGIDIFLETGPNPTLIGLAKKGIKKESALWLGSAKKNINNWKTISTSLKELYLADVAIDWNNVYKEVDAKSIELPTYPWQRKEYWYNPVRGMGNVYVEEVSVKADVASTSNTQDALVVSKDNLMEIMQREAAKIMGMEKGHQLDIYKSVREQGFDSMMAGQFLARIEKYLGTKLEMSLIHVYNDLNSLYNYIVKDILGDNESTTVSISDVMFDANGKNMLEEASGNWHDIKEDDGMLMRLFKKFDKTLGVNDKN